MKRIIVALSFALLAAPVFAADLGAPYEQTVADMALPNVQDPVVSTTQSTLGAPYEQTVANMALPNVKDPVITGRHTLVAGPAVAGASTEATGVWASDPNFIAPAQ
jgi:hypothetical protein